MDWPQLTDRCHLMVDADRSVLRKLLEEAETEFTKRVNCIESFEEFTTTGFAYKLNMEQFASIQMGVAIGDPTVICKTPTLVLFDGNPMKKVSLSDMQFRKEVYQGVGATDNLNQVPPGTPTRYTFVPDVIIDSLYFDKTYGEGHNIKVWYYSLIVKSGLVPQIHPQYHLDLCNYACYMATMKNKPELAGSFLALWNDSIAKAIDSEAERDMLYTIKEEI